MSEAEGSDPTVFDMEPLFNRKKIMARESIIDHSKIISDIDLKMSEFMMLHAVLCWKVFYESVAHGIQNNLDVGYQTLLTEQDIDSMLVYMKQVEDGFVRYVKNAGGLHILGDTSAEIIMASIKENDIDALLTSLRNINEDNSYNKFVIAMFNTIKIANLRLATIRNEDTDYAKA